MSNSKYHVKRTIMIRTYNEFIKKFIYFMKESNMKFTHFSKGLKSFHVPYLCGLGKFDMMKISHFLEI